MNGIHELPKFPSGCPGEQTFPPAYLKPAVFWINFSDLVKSYQIGSMGAEEPVAQTGLDLV